jgi:hypothetical protein
MGKYTAIGRNHTGTMRKYQVIQDNCGLAFSRTIQYGENTWVQFLEDGISDACLIEIK